MLFYNSSKITIFNYLINNINKLNKKFNNRLKVSNNKELIQSKIIIRIKHREKVMIEVN